MKKLITLVGWFAIFLYFNPGHCLNIDIEMAPNFTYSYDLSNVTSSVYRDYKSKVQSVLDSSLSGKDINGTLLYFWRGMGSKCFARYNITNSTLSKETITSINSSEIVDGIAEETWLRIEVGERYVYILWKKCSDFVKDPMYDVYVNGTVHGVEQNDMVNEFRNLTNLSSGEEYMINVSCISFKGDNEKTNVSTYFIVYVQTAVNSVTPSLASNTENEIQITWEGSFGSYAYLYCFQSATYESCDSSTESFALIRDSNILLQSLFNFRVAPYNYYGYQSSFTQLEFTTAPSILLLFELEMNDYYQTNYTDSNSNEFSTLNGSISTILTNQIPSFDYYITEILNMSNGNSLVRINLTISSLAINTTNLLTRLSNEDSIKIATEGFNPCRNEGACSVYANCTWEIDTDAVCSCRDGYSGDGLTCVDVDECLSEICGSNTQCNNNAGSFECVCSTGYRRNDSFTCININECEEMPDICVADAVCRDTEGSYVCTCDIGYSGNGAICTDIDECNTDTTFPCPQFSHCINSIGSFSCICDDGFQLTNNICSDVNECSNSSTCGSNSNCTNQEGTYLCQCNVGYAGQNGVNCKDIDECIEADICGSLATCENTNGSFMCNCISGYVKNDQNQCVDEDECASGNNNCGAFTTCNNLEGSYDCLCIDWFEFSDDTKTSCVDIDECLDTALCSGGQCVNTDGSFLCACSEGFTIEKNNCVDVDECAEGVDECGSGSTCLNNDGSYTCRCMGGFQPTDDDLNCVDIDECNESPSPCLDVASCINNEGSFICECASGYMGDGTTECVDVNECDDNESNECTNRQVCINMEGTYNCECVEYYTGRNCSLISLPLEMIMNVKFTSALLMKQSIEYLTTSLLVQQKFKDIAAIITNIEFFQRTDLVAVESNVLVKFVIQPEDPSTTIEEMIQTMNEVNGDENLFIVRGVEQNPCLPYCPYNSLCVNSTCGCIDGYQMQQYSCRDVNECMDTSSCSANAECFNTIGSFICECKVGFIGDGIVCAVAKVCAQVACNSNEVCNEEGICVCRTGYSGEGCADVNECDASVTLCPDNQICFNTEGGYECQCADGFVMEESACRKLYNCENKICPENSTCTQLENDSECICGEGFILSDIAYMCVEIDECKSDPCVRNAQCTDLVNSFSCSCPRNYEGDGITNCTDIDECTSNPCSYPAVCSNYPGSFKCLCSGGYEENDDGICTDVDECVSNVCMDLNTVCVNTPGSYMCPCGNGYVANSVGMCEDVDECVEGINDCCFYSTCNNTIGGYQCNCKMGFVQQGNECGDVDECQSSTTCHANASCENTIGSFECTCKSGFSGNGVTDCVGGKSFHVQLNRPYTQELADKNSQSFKILAADVTAKLLAAWNQATVVSIEVSEFVQGSLYAKIIVYVPPNSPLSTEEIISGFSAIAEDEFFISTLENVNPCLAKPCDNNAQCSSNGNLKISCTCNTGYYGDGFTCNKENPCNSNPCSLYQTCSSVEGLVSCACAPGTREIGNGNCVDQCADVNYCLNEGECVRTGHVGEPKCVCKPEFTGVRCESRDLYWILMVVFVALTGFLFICSVVVCAYAAKK